MRIGANLDEKEAKALKARLEAQLASTCGGEWCVEVYRAQGRWLARLPAGGARPRAKTGHQVPPTGRATAWRRPLEHPNRLLIRVQDVGMGQRFSFKQKSGSRIDHILDYIRVTPHYYQNWHPRSASLRRSSP